MARTRSVDRSKMVRQAHGGGLIPGAGGGAQPGGGRPAEYLRERLRGTFAERVHVIEEIADGKPVQKTRILLRDLLPYVRCPSCGEGNLMARGPGSFPDLMEIDVVMSASPRDRLGALELAARYGLGSLKEVSVEAVRERMRQTLAVLARRLSPADYQAVVAEIRPLWGS